MGHCIANCRSGGDRGSSSKLREFVKKSYNYIDLKRNIGARLELLTELIPRIPGLMHITIKRPTDTYCCTVYMKYWDRLFLYSRPIETS